MPTPARAPSHARGASGDSRQPIGKSARNAATPWNLPHPPPPLPPPFFPSAPQAKGGKPHGVSRERPCLKDEDKGRGVEWQGSARTPKKRLGKSSNLALARMSCGYGTGHARGLPLVWGNAAVPLYRVHKATGSEAPPRGQGTRQGTWFIVGRWTLALPVRSRQLCARRPPCAALCGPS